MAMQSPSTFLGAPVCEREGGGGGQDLPAGQRRTPKGNRTRSKILFAAGRQFARRGYTAVRLKDIADDVGVTPAMISKYFGSKRALFEAVARVEPETRLLPRMSAEERAMSIVRYWQDPDRRTPAIALLRSLDFDGGELFYAELRRRVTDPLSELIRGQDADARLRLAMGLGVGFGLFGLGILADPDQPPLPEEEINRLALYLGKLLTICIEPPSAEASGAS